LAYKAGQKQIPRELKLARDDKKKAAVGAAKQAAEKVEGGLPPAEAGSG
jgi:hypothetical protein